jgi:hypothetical protein
MIKVLCGSQAYDSLIGRLHRPHVLFGKVPENYVTWNKYDWAENKWEILRKHPILFSENTPCMQTKDTEMTIVST